MCVYTQVFPLPEILALFQHLKISFLFQAEICINLCFIICIYLFLAVPLSLWDLSSLTRNWTKSTAVKVPSPNQWTTREFPLTFALDYAIFLCILSRSRVCIHSACCKPYSSLYRPAQRNSWPVPGAGWLTDWLNKFIFHAQKQMEATF